TFDQPLHLVIGGVAATTGAHETLRRQTKPVDGGGSVEVAVRYEHATLGERRGDIIGGVAAHREPNGWRARSAGGRTVHRHALDRAESFPETTDERFTALMQCGECRLERGPAGMFVTGGAAPGKEVDWRGGAYDP